MGQITKAFAENLLKRVQAGQHINTTVGEEEQLIRGWMYWHEHHYEPRIKAFVADSLRNGIGTVGSEAAQGSSSAANSEESK